MYDLSFREEWITAIQDVANNLRENDKDKADEITIGGQKLVGFIIKFFSTLICYCSCRIRMFHN